jgi:hypothetical protein
VLVELAHRCVFHHDRQNSTIDSPNNPRHCAARSAVALQTALQVALSLGVMEPPHGLPRRFTPRNGEAGVGLAWCFVLRNDNKMKRKNEKALATRGERCEGWEEKRGSEKGSF